MAADGTAVGSSDESRSRSELISSKISSEVHCPPSPLPEHMFVLYRMCVRCQAFARLISSTPLSLALSPAGRGDPTQGALLLRPSPYALFPALLLCQARRRSGRRRPPSSSDPAGMSRPALHTTIH